MMTELKPWMVKRMREAEEAMREVSDSYSLDPELAVSCAFYRKEADKWGSIATAIEAALQRATTEQEPHDEPVGEVKIGSGRDHKIVSIQWYEDAPPDGTKLYTHPKPPPRQRPKAPDNVVFKEGRELPRPILHERDEDGNWICCCGDSLPPPEVGERECRAINAIKDFLVAFDPDESGDEPLLSEMHPAKEDAILKGRAILAEEGEEK